MRTWKDVPGYEGIYIVSNYGDVIRISKNSIRNKRRSKVLFNGSNRKSFLVHRIVASAFLGLDMKDKNTFVDHRNGDQSDNRIENLRLCSASQNQANRKHKGYCWDKRTNSFKVELTKTIGGKTIRIWGGRHKTEEDAIEAYKRKSEEYHGEFSYHLSRE